MSVHRGEHRLFFLLRWNSFRQGWPLVSRLPLCLISSLAFNPAKQPMLVKPSLPNFIFLAEFSWPNNIYSPSLNSWRPSIDAICFSMIYDKQQLIPFHVIKQEVRELGVEHLLEKQTPCRPWYVRLVLFPCRRPPAAVQKLLVIGKITNDEIRYCLLRTFEGDP